MQRNNFFVRVKRSRDDDPVENLCIVEDAAPSKKRSMRDLDHQLASLNSNADENVQRVQPKRLLLSRVKTLNCADDALIHAAPSSNQSYEMPTKRKREPIKVVVTSGKKTVQSETSDSYVIIDMAQMVTKSRALPEVASAVAAPPKAPISRILDPATRMLDRGIVQAMKNGDFNDISSALMQGANADHQTAALCTTLGSVTSSGCTALMAATLHCNIRMVKRLLTKGVDVTKQNSDGASALELLKLTARNMKDGLEIQALLQNALLKLGQAPSMRSATVRENIRQGHDGLHTSSTGAWSDAMDTEDNYVYDIYCVNNNTSLAEQPQPDETESQQVADRSAPIEESNIAENAEEAYSVVRVEGLRILDNGEVDLMMAYDSDWSDLGDDEEPDSNDERFHGNDYPEDEENEGEELQDSDQEYEHFREQAARTLPPQHRAGTTLDPAAARRTSHGSAAAGKSRTAVRPVVDSDSEEEDDDNGARRVRFAPKGASVGIGGMFAAGSSTTASKPRKAPKANFGFEDLIAQEESAAADAAEEMDSDEDDQMPRSNGYESDECDVYGNPLKSAFRETEQNSDYDLDADDEGKLGVPLNLSSARDLLYDDDDNLPAFERRYGVGKVLRPQLLGGGTGEEGFALQGLYEAPHTTESLQELWGEEECNREDYAQGDRGGGGGGGAGGREGEHGDRLQHMRQRTGMVFAAAAREFDSSTGLAKYGAELSDDDDEIMNTDGRIEYIGGGAMPSNVGFTGHNVAKLHEYRSSNRPPLDTVAYDSELDGSD